MLWSLAMPTTRPRLPARSTIAGMRSFLPAQHGKSLVRNHLFLVCGNDEGGDPARCGTDLFGVRVVGGGINLEAEPRKPLAYSGTDRRLVLAYSRCEDDSVEADERRRQPRDFTSDTEGEEINRLPCLRAVACQEFAAVGADTRRTEKPGLVIENVFQLHERTPSRTEQI